MPQKHIQSAAIALNPSPHAAVDYARRAAEERRRATEATNEVLASVHETLAVRFAARATESVLAGVANADGISNDAIAVDSQSSEPLSLDWPQWVEADLK